MLQCSAFYKIGEYILFSFAGGQALVGYFPDLMQSRRSYQALKKFLDATYHFLEHDPFQNKLGGIGIVTSPQVAFQLQLDTSRPLRYPLRPDKSTWGSSINDVRRFLTPHPP